MSYWNDVLSSFTVDVHLWVKNFNNIFKYLEKGIEKQFWIKWKNYQLMQEYKFRVKEKTAVVK